MHPSQIIKLQIAKKKVLDSQSIQLPLNRYISYHYRRPKHLLEKIGNREVVGYGFNGVECYADRTDFPFPAIRYKEPTPEIMALREKEKGDWRLLSNSEKKNLYRATFRQTFAEMKYPKYYEGAEVIGYGLMLLSVGLWISTWLRLYVYDPYPISFTRPYWRAQYRRMIDLQMNPVTGLSSNWDYEKNDWKKKGWFTMENPFEGDDWCTS